MPFKDPDKKREYQRAYCKTPNQLAKGRERNKINYYAKLEWLDQYKTPCVICGEAEKCCIDFHHIDESTKVSEVATLLRQRSRRDIILEEINKCVTLCANCHRKVHKGIVQLPNCHTQSL